MSEYCADRVWSDQWVPILRGIIGPYLLVPSSLEQDRTQAADLVTLIARNMTIGCRVRRPGYGDRYPGEFTIRSERDTGARTELEKILEGWGDWFFYGHANGQSIYPWWLIDLNVFRAHVMLLITGVAGYESDGVLWGQRRNSDGTSFLWFRVDAFPSSLLLSSSVDRLK